MIVRGINSFRDWFRGYEEQYAIIGGTACDLLMAGEGLTWELRPGNNRVFFFYFRNDTYVLLHHFRKKSQQTPAREIRRAQNERDDYIARKEREA